MIASYSNSIPKYFKQIYYSTYWGLPHATPTIGAAMSPFQAADEAAGEVDEAGLGSKRSKAANRPVYRLRIPYRSSSYGDISFTKPLITAISLWSI